MAILIRALEPLEGIDYMLKRTGKPTADYTLTKGPGNLARAHGHVQNTYRWKFIFRRNFY